MAPYLGRNLAFAELNMSGGLAARVLKVPDCRLSRLSQRC
jgi:hypothetical protein